MKSADDEMFAAVGKSFPLPRGVKGKHKEKNLYKALHLQLQFKFFLQV
jgi:hypothetical protein